MERVPKKGFYALKAASSPVLLSLVPFRERLEVGGPPLMEAWLVSDLPRPLRLRVRLWLEGEGRLPLWEGGVGLEAGEAKRSFHLMELWEAPLEAQAAWAPVQEALRSLPPGEYRLVGEAWEGDRLWSRHQVALTYLPPLLPPGVAW